MTTVSTAPGWNRAGRGARTSPNEARAILSARMRTRRSEIEQAILTRILALFEVDEVDDPQYSDGLRATVSASVDYGLVAIELGEERSPPIPAALLHQARLAARGRVDLDAVLRRYVAGYSLLGDFLIQEAQEGGLLRGAELQRVMQAPATVFERLIATVVKEYTRESEGRSGSEEERNAERVRRLLAGELLDTSVFNYEFDAWHVALVTGPGGLKMVQGLASTLDRRLLLAHSGEDAIWAWLGGRDKVEIADFEQHFPSSWPAGLAFSIGEPAHGLSGWRLTHQQAHAGLPIALRSACGPVRYADVALVASMLQDDLLATSLRELYLAPLAGVRDGGEVARQTLRAYFAAERNVSSAAAAIGVSRRTVANRLRAIEARLGCSLGSIGPEIEAALRLHDLGSVATSLDVGQSGASSL